MSLIYWMRFQEKFLTTEKHFSPLAYFAKKYHLTISLPDNDHLAQQQIRETSFHPIKSLKFSIILFLLKYMSSTHSIELAQTCYNIAQFLKEEFAHPLFAKHIYSSQIVSFFETPSTMVKTDFAAVYRSKDNVRVKLT